MIALLLFLLLTPGSMQGAGVPARTFPVTTSIETEPMLQSAESNGLRYSRRTHHVIPLDDGGAFVLWTQRTESIYINGDATFIVRIGSSGHPVTRSMRLAPGLPSVVMNERVAFVVVGEKSCTRFGGCYDTAALYIINRSTASLTKMTLSGPTASELCGRTTTA